MVDDGCGCMGTMSLLAMPAYQEDGTLDQNDGFFGCDARGTKDGKLCPEFTLFEGNIYGWKTTPRTCDEPNDKGHFTKCDGEGQLSFDASTDGGDGKTYGPDSEATINTTLPFDVKIDFHASDDGETFTGYTIRLEQDDYHMEVTREGEYLAGLSKYLKQGMVFNMRHSTKETDLDWLQHGKCSGECKLLSRPQVLIKNLRATSLDQLYPHNMPNADDYEWNMDYTLCDYEQDECLTTWRCIDCKMSYPKDDPQKWDSKDAMCRCHSYTYPLPEDSYEFMIYCPKD